MANRSAVNLMESIYARVDHMVRAILETWPSVTDAYTVNILFDGGGAALVAGIQGQVEVPMAGRLVGARMFVGATDTASSAGVSALIGTYEQYPDDLLSINGTGTAPTLATEIKAEVDITDWLTTIYARDIIAYTLTSFTGSAQHLTLALLIRKTPEVGQRPVPAP